MACAPAAPPVSPAGSTADPKPLRVGTSGDYAPFSLAGPDGRPRGYSVALAERFAAARGLSLRFERFRWPELLAELRAGRFEVAASGVTVRPERSLRGRFSLPVAETGAVLLIDPSRMPARAPGDLDREGMRIAVHAGGHLERIGRRHFRRARIVPVAPNDRVPELLLEERADAVLTDSQEAPHWLRRVRSATGARWSAIGPFTRDRKALLWHPDEEARARSLDAWLLDAERSGALQALRRRWLGPDAQPTATALRGVAAVLEERLSLMPAVAEAKRRGGLPLRDRPRERRVLADLAASYADECRSLGRSPGPEELAAVRALGRAAIEAAVARQEAVLSRPPAPGVPEADLGRELRPALVRLGGRLAWLLARLAPEPAGPALREELRRGPAHAALPEALLERVAGAVADLIRARRGGLAEAGRDPGGATPGAPAATGRETRR